MNDCFRVQGLGLRAEGAGLKVRRMEHRRGRTENQSGCIPSKNFKRARLQRAENRCCSLWLCKYICMGPAGVRSLHGTTAAMRTVLAQMAYAAPSQVALQGLSFNSKREGKGDMCVIQEANCGRGSNEGQAAT